MKHGQKIKTVDDIIKTKPHIKPQNNNTQKQNGQHDDTITKDVN